MGGLSAESEAVEATAATTVTVKPAKEYTTYYSSLPLDFTNAGGLEAYVVTAVSETTATLTQVTLVPAGTGLILRSTGEAGSYTIAVATTEPVAVEKLLVGVTTDMQLESNSAYVLADGKLVTAAAGTLPANRAYLPKSSMAANAHELTFVIADATGIASTLTNSQESTAHGETYNLAGQRVRAPRQGLYIVGNKKLISR